MGSSKKALQDKPEDVKDIFGFGLHQAQVSSRHPQAKPLSGVGSAGALEVVEDDDGSTRSAVPE